MATTWVGGSPTTAHTRGGTGQVTVAGTMKYGSLDETEAIKIQKKFLSIAKRSMIFARFAQKETKERQGGLEVRWKRFEKFGLPLVPLAEGVKPPADSLLQTIIKVKLNQFGSYVATTDVLVAAAQDPIIQQITERQSIQAAELMDFLTYLHARSGTQAAFAGGSARASVQKTLGNQIGVNAGTPGTANTNLLDVAVRTLEYQEARKIAKQMTPSPKYNTEPVPEAYVAVGHTDLRKDIEGLPGFIPYQKYSNNGQQMLPGEIGAVGVIRFVLTTQAAPFGKDPAGTEYLNLSIASTQGTYTPGHTGQSFGSTDGTVADSNSYGKAGATGQGGNAVSGVSGHAMVTTVAGTKFQVYPVLIFSAESLGCVTLSGYDAVIPKVVMPQPAVTDPLGQSGSVGWKSWYACQILNEDWIYRIEVACSTLS